MWIEVVRACNDARAQACAASYLTERVESFGWTFCWGRLMLPSKSIEERRKNRQPEAKLAARWIRHKVEKLVSGYDVAGTR